jgi:hypothetical protein
VSSGRQIVPSADGHELIVEDAELGDRLHIRFTKDQGIVLYEHACARGCGWPNEAVNQLTQPLMMKVVVHAAYSQVSQPRSASPRCLHSTLKCPLLDTAKALAYLVVLVRCRRLATDIGEASDLGRRLCAGG